MSLPAHPWNVSPAEAREIQERLAEKVETCDRLGKINFVAGVDVGFEKSARGPITRAAAAVLTWPGLELQETAVIRQKTTFPYVPGLLSFREIPALMKALDRLQQSPDLILVDGQGYAHPRRFGIACHLGVLTGLPTIGVAKSRLIGTHRAVPKTKGRWVPLLDGEKEIGAVLRTRTDVKPLYISLGHRISLPTALEYVLGCITRYRLPETTRAAHHLASSKEEPRKTRKPRK